MQVTSPTSMAAADTGFDWRRYYLVACAYDASRPPGHACFDGGEGFVCQRSKDLGASTVQDVMARNEVSLLLSLYAYQVLHGLRCLLERQTRQGWSLSRMREQVLKVAATLRLHARRITVHLGAAADKWWPTLLKGLPKLTALS